MRNAPTFPNAGTQNYQLLAALLRSPDARVLNPARSFGMVQNSRASNLRLDHGWKIERCSEPPRRKGGRRLHGYQLTSVAQIRWGRKQLDIELAA